MQNIESLKLYQIKYYVYKLAKVKTTKQLKNKFNADYRTRAGWLKAYEFLKTYRDREARIQQAKYVPYYTKTSFNQVLKHWFDVEDNVWRAMHQGSYDSFVKFYPNVKVAVAA
ncbi:MAG: hypothetical protein AAFR37_21445 [Cyanobacteria bacterium J06628_3]